MPICKPVTNLCSTCIIKIVTCCNKDDSDKVPIFKPDPSRKSSLSSSGLTLAIDKQPISQKGSLNSYPCILNDASNNPPLPPKPNDKKYPNVPVPDVPLPPPPQEPSLKPLPPKPVPIAKPLPKLPEPPNSGKEESDLDYEDEPLPSPPPLPPLPPNLQKDTSTKKFFDDDDDTYEPVDVAKAIIYAKPKFPKPTSTYSCTMCDKFSNKLPIELQEHILTVHQQSGVTELILEYADNNENDLFECLADDGEEDCDFQCNNRGEWLQHLLDWHSLYADC